MRKILLGLVATFLLATSVSASELVGDINELNCGVRAVISKIRNLGITALDSEVVQIEQMTSYINDRIRELNKVKAEIQDLLSNPEADQGLLQEKKQVKRQMTSYLNDRIRELNKFKAGLNQKIAQLK